MLSLILGNVAYAAMAAALLVRDILWLRILGIFANLGFIAANLASRNGPNYTFMAWSALFVAINCGQIALLWIERFRTDLSDEDRDLHAAVFSNLPTTEFRRLLAAGKRTTFPIGEILVGEGGRRDDVIVIEHGVADVSRSGQVIAQRKDGDMIGEMAFVTHRPFSAQIRVTDTLRAVCWQKDTLQRLFVRRPSLALGFHAAFIGHLQNTDD